MSDKTYTTLPTNRNDKENERFGLTSSGKVGVRVVDALKGSDGEYIDVYLGKEITLILEQLKEMNENLAIAVNHMRQISGLETEKGDIF